VSRIVTRVGCVGGCCSTSANFHVVHAGATVHSGPFLSIYFTLSIFIIHTFVCQSAVELVAGCWFGLAVAMLGRVAHDGQLGCLVTHLTGSG
jgi:hypothetical protein